MSKKLMLNALRELNDSDEMKFLEGLSHWSRDDREWFTFLYQDGMTHEEHLKILKDNKFQEKINPKFVPSTMLYAFIVNDIGQEVIVGRSSIRHYLNENLKIRGGHIGYAVIEKYRKQGLGQEILNYSLDYCRDILKLSEILITCSDKNIPSFKIIEKAGGVLVKKIEDPHSSDLLRHYIVHL